MSTPAGRRGAVLVVAAVLCVLAATAPPVGASTLATLELAKDRAIPGEEVAFRGWYYNDVHPVIIHWGAVDGPVLTTVTPETFGLVHNHFRSISGSFRIPPDARPGTHLLVAAQEFAPPGKITWGVPARAEIRVGDGAPRAGEDTGPPVAGRRPSIAVARGPGILELSAAAAAGAAGATLLVGLAILVRKRRVPA